MDFISLHPHHTYVMYGKHCRPVRLNRVKRDGDVVACKNKGCIVGTNLKIIGVCSHGMGIIKFTPTRAHNMSCCKCTVLFDD